MNACDGALVRSSVWFLQCGSAGAVVWWYHNKEEGVIVDEEERG